MQELTLEQLAGLFPARRPEGNKGDFGRALLVCGSYRMPGAACMSTLAAVRSGAGLVELAFPQSAYAAITPKLNEPILLPVEDCGGQLCAASVEPVLQAAARADAVLIGGGSGRGPETDRAVCELIERIQKPLVIDADGINILAEHIDLLERRTAPTVLTPHPGEMGRLMGITAAEVQADRTRGAEYFAQYPNVTLVLKGAGTIIAAPDGTRWRNPTGNCGMAKGGSGDVLAGMAVSFLAQGMSPPHAAAAAVYVHGLCGDRCAQGSSLRGMLPTDMIGVLPKVLSCFEK